MKASLRKLKYRLRRFLLPRKHIREVRDIRINQLMLMRANCGIRHYNDLMKNGFLGDTLWYKYHGLISAKYYYEREIRKLKDIVRTKRIEDEEDNV